MSQNQNDYFDRFVHGAIPSTNPEETAQPPATTPSEDNDRDTVAEVTNINFGDTTAENYDEPSEEPEILPVIITLERPAVSSPAGEVLEEISEAMGGVLRFENVETDGDKYKAEIQIYGPVSSPIPGLLAMGRHPRYGDITVSYDVGDVAEAEEELDYDFSEDPEIEGLVFALRRADEQVFAITDGLPVLTHLLDAVKPVIGEHAVQAVEVTDEEDTLHVTLTAVEEGALDPRILGSGLAHFQGTLPFPNIGDVHASYVDSV